MTRVFDAPCELVFEAFTDPSHLMKWWGPHGCTVISCETPVSYSVRQIEVKVPTLAFVHLYPVTIKKELYVCIGGERNVEPYLSIFISQVVVTMLSDDRAGGKFQKSHRQQRTLERCEDLSKGWTPVKDRRVHKRSRSSWVRIKLSRNTSHRAQSHAGPLTLVVAGVEVDYPFVRHDLLEIRLQRRWIESKWQFAATDHRMLQARDVYSP